MIYTENFLYNHIGLIITILTAVIIVANISKKRNFNLKVKIGIISIIVIILIGLFYYLFYK